MSQEIQEKQLLSLFFLYFTPTYPRQRVPARTCVCVRGVVKEERSPRDPHRMPDVAPRSRTFAPCGGLAPMVANDPKVALGPTGANVANRSAIPPAVGTWRKSGQGPGRGNRPPLRQSLFCLSGFLIGAEKC